MDFVQTIIVAVVFAIAFITCPRKDTFIDNFKLKGSYKSFELEISTKQKNDPPSKSDRSRFK